VALGAPPADYIGFGNSSYSFFNGHVYANQPTIAKYLEAVESGRDPISLARKATGIEVMSRYFVLGVKLRRVPRQPFIDQFGLTPEDVFGKVLDDLTERGMIRLDGDDYVITSLGAQYVNNVCKAFYVGENRGRGQYPQMVSTLTRSQVKMYSRKIQQHRAAAEAVPAAPVPAGSGQTAAS
jgi:oxygen-independent coproporphyrinogen-3 oxidase